MKINILLHTTVQWNNRHLKLIEFCNYWGVNPQEFAKALLRKHSKKDLTEKQFLERLSNKISKPIKKISYNKENKRMTFKIAGIKIQIEFICPRTEDHCNIGSMLVKLRNLVKTNTMKHRGQNISIVKAQSNVIWERLARNPQLKFVGMKAKKVKSH